MSKAAIMDMERKFSNSTFDWYIYRFHHGWTSICPTLHIWKLLTASLTPMHWHLCASLATCRSTEIGVNFTSFFQSVINITPLLGRQNMKLFSTVILTEIGSKTQEICQWKSLKLDQLSYAERSRVHFGLPTLIKYIVCWEISTINTYMMDFVLQAHIANCIS